MAKKPALRTGIISNGSVRMAVSMNDFRDFPTPESAEVLALNSPETFAVEEFMYESTTEQSEGKNVGKKNFSQEFLEECNKLRKVLSQEKEAEIMVERIPVEFEQQLLSGFCNLIKSDKNGLSKGLYEEIIGKSLLVEENNQPLQLDLFDFENGVYGPQYIPPLEEVEWWTLIDHSSTYRTHDEERQEKLSLWFRWSEEDNVQEIPLICNSAGKVAFTSRDVNYGNSMKGFPDEVLSAFEKRQALGGGSLEKQLTEAEAKALAVWDNSRRVSAEHLNTHIVYRRPSMNRTDTSEARPLSEEHDILLRELLDAHSACQNTINYKKRQAYYDEYTGGNTPTNVLKAAVKNAVTQKEITNKFRQEIGSSAAQQHYQKNGETWSGFFDQLEQYRDPNDNTVTNEPSPPGYWKDDGRRKLHGIFRNERFDIQYGERSRLRIPVGKAMKERYGLGYREKLWLEISGTPRWTGDDARFELTHDQITDSFTAHHSVSNPTLRDSRGPLLAAASRGDGAVAAVGANNLAAVVTSNGHHRLYDGATPFQEFKRTSEEIARLKRKLDDGQHMSNRIKTLYEERTETRNHMQDGLVRDLAEWLCEKGVTELIVGKLDGVLDDSHWNPDVNLKNVNFWAHGRFRKRLSKVLEDEYGITVREESEAGTSSRCPSCDSEDVVRHGDELYCPACCKQGHSDLGGALNFLEDETSQSSQSISLEWPMARPLDRTGRGAHDWSAVSGMVIAGDSRTPKQCLRTRVPHE